MTNGNIEPKLEEREKLPENVLTIGQKPFIKYIIALNSMLLKNIPEIHVRARGRQVSRAIDLVEFGKRVHGLKCIIDPEHWIVKSEKFTSTQEKGKEVFVTCVELILTK